jgi:hypothetical protein
VKAACAVRGAGRRRRFGGLFGGNDSRTFSRNCGQRASTRQDSPPLPDTNNPLFWDHSENKFRQDSFDEDLNRQYP